MKITIEKNIELTIEKRVRMQNKTLYIPIPTDWAKFLDFEKGKSVKMELKPDTKEIIIHKNEE